MIMRLEMMKMKGIEFVKIEINKSPVDLFLVEVRKTYIFKGEFFNDCETIEEIRDKFYKETQDEYIKYISVWTFKTKEDLDKKKQYEYIGE